MNAGTPSARCGPRPMPRSLSQINRRGTRPSCRSSCQVPSSRSSVVLVGIIRPSTNLEWAAVITNTGNRALQPSSTGILRGGNHKSHWVASPASQAIRSAGSGRRYCGRNRATFSRNQVIDPVQPIRSAITVAGIPGSSSRIARTLTTTASNDDPAGFRSYFGGPSDANALATVDRPIPNSLATCR